MATQSPLSGKLVTLFGGAGFIGTYVAQALLERGARLRLASRNPEEAFSLKPLADLGQLQFARCDILNEASVEACVDGADAVVNLVGAFGGDMMALMGNAAGTIAQKAREAGATAHVYVSAIAADANSEAEYARAKALGEALVTEAFPKSSIIRPSILFGKDDNFLNMFAQMIQTLPALPVFAPDAPLQLVFVDDVAEAIVTALESPAKHGGKIFELGGPERLTMMEINRRIAAAQYRNRTFIPMPDVVSGVFAALPLTPMSRDQWTMLQEGDVVSGDHSTFKQLGIEPRPLGLFLDRWMVRYRKHGRFGMTPQSTR